MGGGGSAEWLLELDIDGFGGFDFDAFDALDEVLDVFEGFGVSFGEGFDAIGIGEDLVEVHFEQSDARIVFVLGVGGEDWSRDFDGDLDFHAFEHLLEHLHGHFFGAFGQVLLGEWLDGWRGHFDCQVFGITRFKLEGDGLGLGARGGQGIGAHFGEHGLGILVEFEEIDIGEGVEGDEAGLVGGGDFFCGNEFDPFADFLGILAESGFVDEFESGGGSGTFFGWGTAEACGHFLELVEDRGVEGDGFFDRAAAVGVEFDEFIDLEATGEGDEGEDEEEGTREIFHSGDGERGEKERQEWFLEWGNSGGLLLLGEG